MFEYVNYSPLLLLIQFIQQAIKPKLIPSIYNHDVKILKCHGNEDMHLTYKNVNMIICTESPFACYCALMQFYGGPWITYESDI